MLNKDHMIFLCMGLSVVGLTFMADNDAILLKRWNRLQTERFLERCRDECLYEERRIIDTEKLEEKRHLRTLREYLERGGELALYH